MPACVLCVGTAGCRAKDRTPLLKSTYTQQDVLKQNYSFWVLFRFLKPFRQTLYKAYCLRAFHHVYVYGACTRVHACSYARARISVCVFVFLCLCCAMLCCVVCLFICSVCVNTFQLKQICVVNFCLFVFGSNFFPISQSLSDDKTANLNQFDF